MSREETAGFVANAAFLLQHGLTDEAMTVLSLLHDRLLSEEAFSELLTLEASGIQPSFH